MGTSLKFEFDFDEVFEGIKQGVIRELSETNFEEAKESAINSIKSEVNTKIALTYRDENELKDEIKNEIKEKVFENLIKDIDEKYLEKFEVYVNEQLCKNPDRIKETKKKNFFLKKKKKKLVRAVVADAFNPSIWEAEADRLKCSRPAWSTQ